MYLTFIAKYICFWVQSIRGVKLSMFNGEKRQAKLINRQIYRIVYCFLFIVLFPTNL
jgi:hypothetical protein